MMAAVAATSRGSVAGTTGEGVAAFRGMAYAAPPLGERRFRLPEPVEPWEGERSARAFSAGQPQAGDAFVEQLGLGPIGPMDEDCLYLNVWTPAADGGRRPVLVWVHGGAFAGGSACTPLYDGSRLARRGDVVVATFNYRVGLLGFGFFEGVPPNLGLQDQIAALRWVREEIAGFGGDPDNVTLFGESAGAGSIAALCAMPGARGLFRRAIVQSAAPDGMIHPPEAERRARLLAARLGCEPRLEALRELPVDRIVEAQTACAAEDGPFSSNMLFLPVIDGEVLPRRPLHAFRDGEAFGGPLIIGTTAEEMGLYASEPAVAAFDHELLVRYVRHALPPEIARDAVATYADALRAQGLAADAPAIFCAIESDRILRFPSTQIAGWHSGRQAQTYMYRFTWRSPIFDGALGSCHALDLPFTFGTLDAPGMPEFAGRGEEPRRLAGHLMDAWLAFARSGDPSHAGIGRWPAYTPARRLTLGLGPEPEILRAPGETTRVLWEPGAD